MGEARLRAEEKLAALNASYPTMTERAHVMLNELCENLAKNYHELEKSVTDRVDVSKQTLIRLQNETRDLVKYVSSMRKLLPA
jgi:septation ring formation regulator EzrA